MLYNDLNPLVPLQQPEDQPAARAGGQEAKAPCIPPLPPTGPAQDPSGTVTPFNDLHKDGNQSQMAYTCVPPFRPAVPGEEPQGTV